MTNVQTRLTFDGRPVGAPALRFEGIEMVFPDGTHALRETTFDVCPGEFVTIVGPSGCGKSTLLRIASGLNPQTGGSLEVDRSRIGYVFQDATLLQWRTVQRNVELLAELEGMPKAERKRRADDGHELAGADRERRLIERMRAVRERHRHTVERQGRRAGGSVHLCLLHRCDVDHQCITIPPVTFIAWPVQ